MLRSFLHPTPQLRGAGLFGKTSKVPLSPVRRREIFGPIRPLPEDQSWFERLFLS